MNTYRHAIIAAVLVASLSLGACASMPEAPVEQAEFKALNDPFEPTNRVLFDFNDFLDRLLIAPLAGLYRVMVPPPVRYRISNILSNMSEPVILANNLLQGEFGRAGTTFTRFVTNTTLGVGGVFEVANEFNLRQQQGDFGQTLFVWGLKPGPYIVLPIFGPSSLRDAIGRGVDTMISPWKYVVAMGDNTTESTFTYTDMGASGLNRREAVLEAYDALREGSLDFYAQMRSVYRQHRAKQLGEALLTDTPQFEDYESDGKAPVLH